MKLVLFLLSFTLFTTIAQAQYEDDNVTIHSNRKAKDPFKSNKETDSSRDGRFKTIHLTDFSLNDKMPSAMEISGIQIINAVSDSSVLGYVQVGTFNRWMQAQPDKPYTQYLQTYVNRRYGPIYKQGAAQLIWVIQELRINERTFSMSEKGFLHLKAMAFSGNGTFKLITQLDTILVKGGMDVTSKHGDNIGDALQILLEQSLTKQGEGPAYSLSEIQEKAVQRYQKPALQSKEHVDGIYLTFENFMNDQPSFNNVEYTLDHNNVRFYYTDSSGKKTFVDKFWGVRKKGLLLKQHNDLLIPIQQMQNGIALSDYLPLARRKNNTILLGAAGGGLIGAALADKGAAENGTLPAVENIPYLKKRPPLATSVDIETGEFTL
jgi:hypothetical protein